MEGFLVNNFMKTIFSKHVLSLAVVLGLLPVISFAQQGPQLPEDVFPALRPILEQAVQQSPQMVSRNLELLAADGDLTQAKAGMYPSLSGFYRYSQTSDQREDIAERLKSDKTYYSITLTQPLFHWGEHVNNAKIGEIRREIADENYSEAYRLLANQIRASYLSLIMNKIGVTNAAYSLKLADEALASAEDRLEKKVISEGAIFQTRIAADQARLANETAVWTYALAKQSFSKLTGQPASSDYAIPSEIPALIESKDKVDALLAGFLSQEKPETAALRIARKNVMVSDLTYKNQRTQQRPKLSFVAGISQDEQSYTSNIAQKYGVESQYVGLQVSWNIFDGFATRGAVASALARKRMAEHSYKQLTETLAQDARKAAKAVDLAQRQLAISERLLNNAGNFLNYTRDELKRGQSSEAEINAAQAGYNGTKSSTNSSRYIYLMRVSEFVSLIAADPLVRQIDQN
jgi:outer membrane protein TolC